MKPREPTISIPAIITSRVPTSQTLASRWRGMVRKLSPYSAKAWLNSFSLQYADPTAAWASGRSGASRTASCRRASVRWSSSAAIRARAGESRLVAPRARARRRTRSPRSSRSGPPVSQMRSRSERYPGVPDPASRPAFRGSSPPETNWSAARATPACTPGNRQHASNPARRMVLHFVSGPRIVPLFGQKRRALKAFSPKGCRIPTVYEHRHRAAAGLVSAPQNRYRRRPWPITSLRSRESANPRGGRSATSIFAAACATRSSDSARPSRPGTLARRASDLRRPSEPFAGPRAGA